MGEIDHLKPATNMTELERYTIHAVRQVLQAVNTYHSVFHIVITQKSPTRLEITAWIPETTTMPNEARNGKPVVPIHFYHSAKPMMDFIDVDFWPIARELGKEMNNAIRLGANYGRAV